VTDPIKWDEAALQALIRDAVTESLTLDYKAAAAITPKTDSVKREVSKDVSAFANSAGGTIVYGMVESNHLPVAIDGIDPLVVTREWLDQVIASRIQRRIDGVRINQVILADGKVVYIVVIPESDRAPHMASDHRYHKRFEYQSVPMEDYEVRDVANRAVGPRLSIKMWLETDTLTFADDGEKSQPLRIRAQIVNESAVPAEHAVFHILVDCRLEGAPTGFMNRSEVSLSLDGGPPVPHHLWQQNWGVPGKLPIWNGMNFSLSDSFEVRLPRGPGQYAVAWSAKAPRMAHASEILILATDDGRSVELRGTGISIGI